MLHYVTLLYYFPNRVGLIYMLQIGILKSVFLSLSLIHLFFFGLLLSNNEYS